MRLSFTVYGQPVPLARARVVRSKRGKTHAYTPERSEKYKDDVRWAARTALAVKFSDSSWPKDKLYRLTLRLFFGDNRKRDISNVQKAIEDALNQVVWNDDCQIVEVHARKWIRHRRPYTEVLIEVVDVEMEAA